MVTLLAGITGGVIGIGIWIKDIDHGGLTGQVHCIVGESQRKRLLLVLRYPIV